MKIFDVFVHILMNHSNSSMFSISKLFPKLLNYKSILLAHYVKSCCVVGVMPLKDFPGQ